MKIVIDIPEKTFKYYVTLANKGEQIGNLESIILDGTPLPKGHGALIDRSEVIKSLFDYHNGKKTIGQCIEDVQTIIEADWEDEEE